ncbi:MAG: response regulator transcription factor [Tateyamaria sp.]|uniref:response regulator transcription factor n=1 Tax=Tateyamaria sp. TaxID=1929288 RepID=UPI0032722DB2
MRVLIADDHDLVRESIATVLIAEGNCEAATAGSLFEALEIVQKEGTFDLILLDYNMPGMCGLVGLQSMIAVNNTKPVALISGTTTKILAEEAISLGAAGFVPKTLGAKSMICAARFMVSGEIYAPFNFMRKTDDNSNHSLTDREHEVLQGICRGQSNKEIGNDCQLGEATIKLHAKTLSRKLGAKNRTHAAMIARDLNLV